MAQAAVPCFRSGFESATEVQPVASSSDEDDDGYIPESLRLFVAQAEMKQESVLSLISNEMSGEEIEKTISEDFEATIIDLPPPSASAASGHSFSRVEESADSRSEGTANSNSRPRLTKKRIATSDNASHLRRLLGSSASKPKQVQQRPIRRRPLSDRSERAGHTSASPAIDCSFELERSPSSSWGCQTSSVDELKKRLYSPLLPENPSTVSDEHQPGTLQGRTSHPEAVLVAPQDLCVDNPSDNPGLSTETFEEEEEVPESLRFLFEQADQALRQTQQEFLDVAQGCHKGPLDNASCSNKPTFENKGTPSSLTSDDKSVEFPLSLFAVGVVSVGSECDAPSVNEGGQPTDESVDLPSDAFLDGVQPISNLELEPILVPVSRCNSELGGHGMASLEPNSDVEPLLIPLMQCDAGLVHDEDMPKPYRVNLHASRTQEKREQDVSVCEVADFGPVNQVDSSRVVEEVKPARSPVESHHPLEPGSVRAPAVELFQESVSIPWTRSLAEVEGSDVICTKDPEQLPRSDRNRELGISDTLGDAAGKPLLMSNEKLPEQEVQVCIGTNPEPSVFTIGLHQDQDSSGNVTPSADETDATRQVEVEVSFSTQCAGAVPSVTGPTNATPFTGDRNAEGIQPEPFGDRECTSGVVSPTSEFDAKQRSNFDMETQVASGMISEVDERSFDRSYKHLEDEKLVVFTSLVTTQAASEPLQICDVPGDVAQTPTPPRGGISSDVLVRFSPCPSDDNQTGNYMPMCCSPAQASSTGTKSQLPEAQETESEESSIRNPPLIVQVPSSAPQQIVNSPEAIDDANVTKCSVAGQASAACGELITNDRVSSTLTESFSDDDESVEDGGKSCTPAPLPIGTNLDGQKQEVTRRDEGSPTLREAMLQLKETNDSPAGAKASTSRNDVPIFGAFTIPKSILSFVALADEMIEKQQSLFVCCSHEQFVPVSGDDHVLPSNAESTASSNGGQHSLEKQDSIWEMFNGSGSTDPNPVIPVEAVLKCSPQEISLENSKLVMAAYAEAEIGSQTNESNEESTGICRKQRSESNGSPRTYLGSDVDLDERNDRAGCLVKEDVAEKALESVAQSSDCVPDEYVVEIVSESTSQLSVCGTRSQEKEPSVLSPPTYQRSFDSHSVHSIESSQGWTEKADELHSGSHSTVGVPKPTNIEANAVPTNPDAARPLSMCHDVAETGEEVLDPSVGERVQLAPWSADSETPVGIENSIILNQGVSELPPTPDFRDMTGLTDNVVETAALSGANLSTSTLRIGTLSYVSAGPSHRCKATDSISGTPDLPFTDGNAEDQGLEWGSEPRSHMSSRCDNVQGTQPCENVTDGAGFATRTHAAEEDNMTNASDPATSPCHHKLPDELSTAEGTEVRLLPEKLSPDAVEGTLKPKRPVNHSPRHWKSSSQKKAEEGRAKAIERIRQRKLKEKESLRVNSSETGDMESKAKRQQYSAKEGVARAIQRMKAFRKGERENVSEQNHSSTTNSTRIEDSSRSKRRCMQSQHNDSGGHNLPMIDKKAGEESARATGVGECGSSKNDLKRNLNERRNNRMRESPRRSFIPGPRAKRDRVVGQIGTSARHSQKLMESRSLDDMQCESLAAGGRWATVALQSALSFPSYMRPTKSSSAPIATADVSLASSSKVLQSMLRSERPVVMNTGLWKWYVRPLPPRVQAPRRK